MAKSRGPNPTEREREPEGRGIELEPATTLSGQSFLVRGRGWDVVPLILIVDGKAERPQRIVLGAPVGGGFRPGADGEFVVECSTRRLRPGPHSVTIDAVCDDLKLAVTGRLDVVLSPPKSPASVRESDDRRQRREYKNAGGGGPLMRREDWFQRRFGHLGFIPDGVRLTQIASVRALRDRARFDKGSPGEDPGNVPGQPVPGACNWTPVGPGPVIVDATTAFAGRVISIAFDPMTANTIFIGAANGGVWKSGDRGRTWSPKSDYQMSLAIGALAIDPSNHLRVFAGTGEYGAAVGTFYGNGILYSSDGGDTWSELASATFQRDEISRLLFDPTDATSQRMVLSSRQGVYESVDGGMSWSLLRAGAASDLVARVTGGNLQLIAGFDGSGVFSATRTAGTWSAWTQYASAAFPAAGTFARIVLGQSRNHPDNVYAAFSDGYRIAGIAKTANGGTTWTTVAYPLWTDITSWSDTAGATPHYHTVTLTGVAMTGATLIYTTGPASAGPVHTHTVTLTAAQLATVRDGTGAVTATSSPASGHSHQFSLERRGSAQTWYDFHISVHPDDPNTVYCGDVQLWKTTTGDGPWTWLSIPHTDNHAFAYAPDDPNQIWSIGDGGVYMSPDAGATFQHRNRDLQTLEYISIAQHPQWETIMIGGTQDNGTHRFTGSPAWAFSDGGDGGFAAIDPAHPSRMYHEYVSTTFYRSDAYGDSGSWVWKSGSVTGGSEFYAPFALDPSATDVCYFGGSQLWRSPDNADTWSAVTAAPLGSLTAIAVHPSDSNTIIVANTGGNVFKVQRTGATWAVADVTTTNITGTGLPAGVYLSDLVVDAMGNIWVSLSSVLWSETTGEFTNDHVYYRAAGGGTWVSRSTGLAQANPVNSIVLDPADPNRLFCGCDVGVFRSDTGGVSWSAWDAGLPNVAVFDLQIHSARRLLRAATHGRSVWERPIDAASCPLVDLYMRDSIIDSGRVQPTPEAVHPFDPSLWAGHWTSEDIKVDGPEPGFQTAAPVDNYVDFASLQHRTARRNATNRFYVQVHNRGIDVAHNVQVRAFFAPTSPGLPPLPADFWTGGRPFAGTPSGPNWTPVGPTRSLGSLEPGEPGIAEWDWLIPNSAPQHSCLLAVATCIEDPITGVGTLDPDLLVVNSKHVTLKNLVVENVVPGTAMPPGQAMMMEVHASSSEDRIAHLRFRWGNLPRATRVFLAFAPGGDGKPVIADSPEWKRLGIEVSREHSALFPESTPDAYGCPVRIARDRVLVVSPGDRVDTSFPGIAIAHDAPLRIVMNLILPKEAAGPYEFDVVRIAGKRTLGGVTYRIRAQDSRSQGTP